MASSADIPHYTRTSFLMSNYHRWTGHISLVLLSNTSRWCLPYCSVLSKVSAWWFTWKHLETEKLLSLTFNTLADTIYLWEIYRWYWQRKQRWEASTGQDVFPFYLISREMIWRLPSIPKRSARSQQSKPTQLASALSHLSARQVSSKAAQENKSEWATFTLTFHLQQ